MKRPSAISIVVVAWLIALAVTGTAAAQAVRAEVSSPEVFVGVPFDVSVIIERAEPDSVPLFPETDELTVHGAPSESRFGSSLTVNNRRVGRTTITYAYRVTARREGIATVPSFEVMVGGRKYTTRPMTVRVSGPNGGDRLILEIVADRETAYLGAPLGLTLQVWVKPFEHEVLGGRASNEQMWNFLDLYRSAWGDFAQPLTSLVGRTGTRPLRGRIAHREVDGVRQAYYLYEVGHTAWPQQTGRLTMKPVIVRMEYPTQIDAARRRVADHDDLLAVATTPDIAIEAAPLDGRPAGYAGAIGRFDIRVRAMPTTVAVGDPITLTINILDDTPEGTILDVLQPPVLTEVPELIDNFRIPADPLAGTVRGNLKTFTQTIRARHADVERVPPIPFVYFDPETESYETAWSAPIPLVVDAGSSVSMSDVVGGDRPDGNTTELTAVDDGLLANVTDVDELLNGEQHRPGATLLVIAGTPPVVALAVGIISARSRRMRDDRGYARRRRAMSVARQRLDEARRADGDRAGLVASAVTSYIGDRLDSPAGVSTRGEVRELLQDRIDEDLLLTVESFLEACEHAAFAGDAATDVDGLIQRGDDCLAALAKERLG